MLSDGMAEEPTTITLAFAERDAVRIPSPFGDSVAMQISPGPSFSKRVIKNCVRNFPFFKGIKGDFRGRMPTLRDREV